MDIGPAAASALFDAIPDVVFFAKDGRGRYTAVNETLVRRCGSRHKHELLGRTAAEVFPGALGRSYVAQDREVIAQGEPILDRLELHLFPNRAPGWCLTRKLPLLEGGRGVGLVGISRDLGQPDERDPIYPRLARAVDELRARLEQPVRVEKLAQRARLSVSQLERQFQRVFQVSPRELLTQLRIERAMRLLAGKESIAAIAQACGYSDHSAFTRQFRAVVGVTPRAYRKLGRG